MGNLRTMITNIMNSEAKHKEEMIVSLLFDESFIPSLDLLETHLEAEAELVKQDDEWHLFDKGGEGIAKGKSIRGLLVNLIFIEC